MRYILILTGVLLIFLIICLLGNEKIRRGISEKLNPKNLLILAMLLLLVIPAILSPRFYERWQQLRHKIFNS